MDLPAVQSLAEWRDDIAARRRSLEKRLDDGYRRLDHALIAGGDIGSWEDFWLRLLREYESVCDELEGDGFVGDDLAA